MPYYNVSANYLISGDQVDAIAILESRLYDAASGYRGSYLGPDVKVEPRHDPAGPLFQFDEIGVRRTYPELENIQFGLPRGEVLDTLLVQEACDVLIGGLNAILTPPSRNLELSFVEIRDGGAHLEIRDLHKPDRCLLVALDVETIAQRLEGESDVDWLVRFGQHLTELANTTVDQRT